MADEAAVRDLAQMILAELVKDEAAVRTLARAFMAELMADPQFRTVLREVVLLVHATSDEQSRDGHVRCLLRACRERGATVLLSKCGGVTVVNGHKLSWDLRDALKMYRQDIIETLAHHNGNGRTT